MSTPQEPDCGSSSCMFSAKGGMRTNGPCRCMENAGFRGCIGESTMTKQEFDEMAALVVRLRTDLELHTDALVKSNAQCAEYLRQNEQLDSDLVEVRASLASVSAERDSLKRTLKEWEEAETKPHARVAADDIADHVVPPVLPMCTKCHYCLHDLEASVFGPYHVCPTVGCPRTVTNNDDGEDKSPYNGPCTSSHPVRHECLPSETELYSLWV